MKISFYSVNYQKAMSSISRQTFLPAYLIILYWVFPLSAAAQTAASHNGKKTTWKIQHTEDFDLTADTSAIAWKNIPWLPLEARKKNPEINYRTNVRLLYSEKGIYVFFWCEDKAITSTLREDFSSLFREDVVEIFFWPDEATPIYFEFELSPLNYELAILVPNLKGDFYGWRPWYYEGDRKTKHLTRVLSDQSWVAEFFIPFSLLKPLQNVPPKKGMKWRANIYRIDYDKGQSTWTWQPIRQNFHDFEMYGTIVFD